MLTIKEILTIINKEKLTKSDFYLLHSFVYDVKTKREEIVLNDAEYVDQENKLSLVVSGLKKHLKNMQKDRLKVIKEDNDE